LEIAELDGISSERCVSEPVAICHARGISFQITPTHMLECLRGVTMGTCEMCGTDRVSTLLSEISGAKLRCCPRCIESNNLTVLERRTHVSTNVSTEAERTRTYTRNISKTEKEVALNFHSRIKVARESKGWSTRDLAKRMNLRLNDVQKAEAGVQPSDSVLKKIEKALDITLFEDGLSEPERSVKTPTSRGLTIGDALDEFLAKE
tara:strand:+ start:669 stop:1286 length:618 start_codon:yes stop_codon:yes gene_type:complete